MTFTLEAGSISAEMEALCKLQARWCDVLRYRGSDRQCLKGVVEKAELAGNS